MSKNYEVCGRDCWLLPLLLLPWLSPYTAGPTPNVWPLLLSALCAVMLWFYLGWLTPRLVLVGWLAAASLSALIGLAQYFGLAAALSPWVSQTAAGEAFANLRQRNQFATLTSIGLAALIGWLALWETRETPERAFVSSAPLPSLKNRPLPWWAYALAGLLALGNAASSSRTGLLQWLALAVFSAWWFLPDRRRLVAFAVQAVLAYGLAVFMLPWLLERVTGLQSGGLFSRLVTSTGCGSRMILWSNVLTLIADKPWLGWGWGELAYAHFMTLYSGPRFCEILDNAHNLPLQLAVELGLPLALLVCGGLAWLVWRHQPWRETDPVRQMAWAVLAVIGLHSLLEYPLWYGPFQIASALCVWLLWRSRHGPPERAGELAGEALKVKGKGAVAQLIRASLAIICIAALAGVALSYHRVKQIYLSPEQRSPAYRDDTMNKIKDPWFFRNQARFAELSLMGLTPENALEINAMAKAVLHYSPEARVAEKVIESAVMLGREDEALRYLARYRAAFPADHARWLAANKLP